MIWYIWWMAIASGLCMWAVIIARVYDDDAEYVLPASEIRRSRRSAIGAGKLRPHADGGRGDLLNQPLPESLT
jgi:hypothetical protein